MPDVKINKFRSLSTECSRPPRRLSCTLLVQCSRHSGIFTILVTANVVLFVAISFLRLLYGPVGGTPVSARAAETAKMHKQALDESLSCATGLRPPEGQKPSMPEPEPEQMNHALVWAKDTAAQAHAALTRAPIPPKTRQQGLIGEWRQQVVAAKAAKPNVDAALAATAYSLQAAMDGNAS